MKTLFFAVAAALLLAACGQTGPLRLPEAKDTAASTGPASGTDSAADKPKTAPKK